MLGGRPRAKQSADFEAAQHRQVEIEQDQIGRLCRRRLERGIAAGDDLDVDVAAALERVLDELGDVVFVFDDEDTCLGTT